MPLAQQPGRAITSTYDGPGRVDGNSKCLAFSTAVKSVVPFGGGEGDFAKRPFPEGG